MKKIIHSKQIFAVLLCMIITLSILPTSIFAAKEMFSPCSYIGIRGCAIPVPGEKPDFDVEENWPSQYTIMSVNWYKDSVSPANAVGGTETFKGNTVYIVEFEVWANDGYYFTNNNGNTTVEADVSPNYAEYGEFEAQVMNVYGQSASKYLTVRYTFPKTEGQNTAEQDPNVISAVNLTGLDLPSHYSKADTSIASDDYRVSTEVVWKNQDGSAFNGVFEYGKSYTAMIYLFVNNSRDFAKDYTHPLATSDKPMPAVTVTLDGEPLSVLPDYTRNQFMRCLVASKVYRCEGKMTLDSIILSDVRVPTAGGAVNYNFTCSQNGYERLESMNDDTYHKGVAWRVDGGSYLKTAKGTFDANETYQIVIRLKPKDGFEFDVDGNGNTRMTATVNGKAAEIKSSKTEAIVTYTFPKTGNSVLDKVEIGGVDAPEAGKTPDYTVSYGANYGAANYNDKSNKNGIAWYNETDKKIMSTSDKFEEGKTYSVQITLWTNEGYEFQYKSGSVNIAAAVNGQSAQVSSRSNVEVTVYYTFPKIPEHKHSPMKVDAVKATCKEEGKKAYYFCPECGKNFEDSKCTKVISDINAWGKTEKLEHTGGKATCDNRAICKNCGEYYGEFAQHQFGTAWDYKDANGHAHKCKVCGIHDTVVPHNGGSAKCGEMAKCSVCKAEYGEVKQHQWSKNPEYSDSKGHAHKCTVCGTHDDIVKHTPGAPATETTSQNCTVCGYMITPATNHKHKLVRMDAVEATCDTAGMKAYYYCQSCDSIFTNNIGGKEITDKDSLIIPATGHKDSKWKSDTDVHWKECSVKGCGVITVEKEAHDFNKNEKCTVCGYKKGDNPDSPQTNDNSNTNISDNSDVTDTDSTEKTPVSSDINVPDTDTGNNTVILIAVIASGVLAVACIIVVIVVLAKKNKKK